MSVATIKSIARSLKDGPYAWPGGYPKVYYTTHGGCLCPSCALDEYGVLARGTFGEKFEGVDIYWEGPVIYCDGCNGEIESAYGDPDSQEAFNG